MAAEAPIITPDPVLGGVIAYHPSDRLKPLLTAAVIGAPIGLVLALTAAQTEAWWGMPVTVGGVAITGLALGWYVLHLWNREVILYQRGFSFREGSKLVYFSYEEVKWIGLQARRMAYFGGLFRRDVYRIEIVTYAGDRMLLTNLYRRVAELGTRLTELVEMRLRPELAHKFASGDKVEFGETIWITREGLDIDDQRLAWADFGGYRIGSGKMTFLKRSGDVFQETPLSRLYNITLLIDFLKQHKVGAENT